MSRWRAANPRVSARGKRFVILASQFNPSLTRSLVRGATEVLDRSGAFALNILTEEMQPLSDLFANNKKSEEERFAAVRHAPGAVTGAPILEGNMGWLECRVAHRYEGGDHTIFVGEVVNAGQAEGKPLVFYKGRYAGLQI